MSTQHSASLASGNPVRVIHIASGDLWAGAESQMYTLVKTLHTMPDIAVSVVLMNHGELERRLLGEGIGVTVLDESATNSVLIFKRLVKLLREDQPDVIHTHRLKENILGSLAGWMAGGIPSIRTAHGAPEHRFTLLQIHKRALRYLDQATGRHVQKRIIAVSNDLAGILRQQFATDRVFVIENGIDENCPVTREHKALQGMTGATPSIDIGIAGRLVQVKRLDIFIHAARYFQQYHPNVQASFHIFGDGPLRSALESLSTSLGSDHYVHFHGHTDNLPGALKRLDILLLTSDHEGLPMVLLESMACRTPVIAHAVGGIPELLDHGECGILVETDAAEDYAMAIHELAQSSDLGSSLVDKATIRIREKYSATSNAWCYLNHYLEVCL